VATPVVASYSREVRHFVTTLVAATAALGGLTSPAAPSSAPHEGASQASGPVSDHAAGQPPATTPARGGVPCDEDDEGPCGGCPVTSAQPRSRGAGELLAKTGYGHTARRGERAWLALLCLNDPSGSASPAR
jgi:hypothetical protein